MGMKSDEKKLKELKNGRLAMVAFTGFCSQAAVTGLGPIEALKAHIADPTHVNIFTSAKGPEAVAAVCVLCLAPMVIEAKNSLSGDEEEEFNPIPWCARPFCLLWSPSCRHGLYCCLRTKRRLIAAHTAPLVQVTLIRLHLPTTYVTLSLGFLPFCFFGVAFLSVALLNKDAGVGAHHTALRARLSPSVSDACSTVPASLF